MLHTFGTLPARASLLGVLLDLKVIYDATAISGEAHLGVLAFAIGRTRRRGHGGVRRLTVWFEKATSGRVSSSNQESVEGRVFSGRGVVMFLFHHSLGGVGCSEWLGLSRIRQSELGSTT